ncbi:MAG: methylated-DNA--[protein]-cysteine S-methyltransferase [Chloroflexota bacterium]
MIVGAPVAVAILPGPWGPVHLAARETPAGAALVAIELLTPTDLFGTSLGRRLGGRPVPASDAPAIVRRLLERARDELAEYFDGRRRSFDLPLDLGGLSAWDRLVLGGVREVPYGAVTSYGRLARRIGRPGAARAAGGAVGRNPLGIVVPCHRVIAGDGTLGGYGGDWFGTRQELLAVKRALLEREGVALPARAFAG